MLPQLTGGTTTTNTTKHQHGNYSYHGGLYLVSLHDDFIGNGGTDGRGVDGCRRSVV